MNFDEVDNSVGVTTAKTIATAAARIVVHSSSFSTNYDDNDIATTTSMPMTTIANATIVTTPPSPSLSFFSFNNLKFWNTNWKICESVTKTFHDFTRDLDPLAAILIVLALIIAIVGIIAIICQCQMWRKSKRKRHYDTSSWLEYSLDRAMLTQKSKNRINSCSNNNNNNNNTYNNMKISEIGGHFNHRQMENKKFISKLFPNSLLTSCPQPVTMGVGGSHNSKKPYRLGLSSQHHRSHEDAATGKAVMNLYETRMSPSKREPSNFVALDIDHGQLVQSFMKYDINGKQYMENRKNAKKDEKHKSIKQKQKKSKQEKRDEKRKSKNKHKLLSSSSSSSGAASKQTKRLAGGLATNRLIQKSSTFFNQSSAGEPHHPYHQSQHQKKEYETQTLELNLTGSEDGESHSNVSIGDDKIYERIEVANHIGDFVVRKVVTKSEQSPPSPPHVPPTASSSQSSSGSNFRLRQQVPPSDNIDSNNNANKSRRIVKSSLPLPSGATLHYQSAPLLSSQPPRIPPPPPPSMLAAGTISKNPLYSEVSEHEETIIFSDDNSSIADAVNVAATAAAGGGGNRTKSTVGGFAFENGWNYARIQPPMSRAVTYSTFIKPTPYS